MVIMTSTEFAKNIKKMLDKVELSGEEIILTRKRHRIARIVPAAHHMTAIEAFGDIYKTISPEAVDGWTEDSRMPAVLAGEMRNPWDT